MSASEPHRGVQQGSTARQAHYGEFYGLVPLPDDAPLTVVSGNCQAESLRIMLDGPDLRTVRIPPVFELVASDLPHLARLLARTRFFVSQPVHDDYHDLPLGTAQLAALLPSGARVVRMPVVRFAGLYPFHAIVRPPFDLSLVPPVVEYHDLRTVMRAWRMREERGAGASAVSGAGAGAAPGARLGAGAGRSAGAAGAASAVAAATVEQVRAVARQSIAELSKREVFHDTVVLSDLFAAPDFGLMRTINHPGNAIWSAAASRVRSRLSLAEHVVDPGRPLLNAVHAPREAVVIEAFGLETDPQPDWIVDGRTVATSDVVEAHLDWYAEYPAIIDAAIARHRGTLETLGLLAAGAAA
ncbi:hypothetical protein B7R22_12940 [Subtercola boreus]|uniref:Polysaccharide biosynthesis enzyme WcbI domain-containing protein n=1 Tax=Subtercola boreus TaxID=120213 RepID=A0A3E0VV55_9MICO|nr:WcbI family polysaccharide biosynthesis putative acetyltransferase [Subtercola boreus]RFA13560.1 hypothetical protein B7R22_12940 [Subtercola boreus]